MNVRTALLGLLVMLTIVFASTTVYESGIRTTVATTTSVVDPTQAIRDAYLFHIFDIASENTIALAAQYATNATVLYDFPNAVPSHGSFSGSTNLTRYVTRFYNGLDCPACFPLKLPYGVANQTYSVTMSNDGKEGNVTSHLIFYGNDPECPVVANEFSCPSGTAYYYVMGFSISYVLQGGHWLISTESVTNMNGFERCVPASLSPSGFILNCPTLQIPS